MRRKLALYLELTGWVAFAPVGTVFLDRTWWGIAPLLQAVAPWSCCLAAVLGACALALVSRRRTIWALCVLSAAVAVGSSLVVRDHPSGEAPGGPLATIVSFNTKMGAADPRALMARLTTLHADVMFLLEADRWFVERLDQAGARSVWPYRLVSAADAPAATAVLSRVALAGGHQDRAMSFVSWEAEAVLGRVPVMLKAVHPAPPLLDLVPQWRSDLRRLARMASTTSGRMLMAGDFNADVAHPAFRTICSAATDLHGCGSFYSRPTWGPLAGSGSILPLDHVLARGLAVISDGSFAVPGSDHRAVWATVAAPR